MRLNMTSLKLPCFTLKVLNIFSSVLQFLKKQISDKMWPEKTGRSQSCKKHREVRGGVKKTPFHMADVQRSSNTKFHMDVAVWKTSRIRRRNCAGGEIEWRWMQEKQSIATIEVSLLIFRLFLLRFHFFSKRKNLKYVVF